MAVKQNQLTTEAGRPVMLTVTELSRGTGINRQTLYSWINGDVKRYDSDVLERLCAYFDCTPGDLIVLEKAG